jgi:hypothetical protein
MTTWQGGRRLSRSQRPPGWRRPPRRGRLGLRVHREIAHAEEEVLKATWLLPPRSSASPGRLFFSKLLGNVLFDCVHDSFGAPITKACCTHVITFKQTSTSYKKLHAISSLRPKASLITCALKVCFERKGLEADRQLPRKQGGFSPLRLIGRHSISAFRFKLSKFPDVIVRTTGKICWSEKTRNPQLSYLISDCNPLFQLL